MNELSKLLDSSTEMVRENHQYLLRAVMIKPGTQAELARRTGRSEGTISEAVRALRQEGDRISPVFQPKQGDRNELVRMAATRGVAVGVELGFQHTYFVARRVDQTDNEAQTFTGEFGAATAERQWPTMVAREIKRLAERVGDGTDRVATVGLGVPRVVDPATGRLLPPLLPPWEGQESPGGALQTALEEKLGYAPPRVPVDNDANLGALGESVYGGRDSETLLYVKVSTGVGAGIMIGGNQLRGRLGIAGELGHMVVEPEGRYCSCGGRGCLETVIGANALVQQAQAALEDLPGQHPTDLRTLVQQANAGNPICHRVLVDAAERLGRVLGDVCNVLSPHAIVIGGIWGIEAKREIIVEACTRGLHQTVVLAAKLDPKYQVTASEVHLAGAHGALILGLQGTR